jgi:hypothetical protein
LFVELTSKKVRESIPTTSNNDNFYEEKTNNQHQTMEYTPKSNIKECVNVKVDGNTTNQQQCQTNNKRKEEYISSKRNKSLNDLVIGSSQYFFDSQFFVEGMKDIFEQKSQE